MSHYMTGVIKPNVLFPDGRPSARPGRRRPDRPPLRSLQLRPRRTTHRVPRGRGVRRQRQASLMRDFKVHIIQKVYMDIKDFNSIKHFKNFMIYFPNKPPVAKLQETQNPGKHVFIGRA